VREPRDLDTYVKGLNDVGAHDLAMHSLRALVLERFVALDAALNDVLALSFARDQQAADTLSEEVFARLSMTDRISMLTRLLDERDLTDRWPFLPRVLPRLRDLRNQLAHGFVQRLADGQFEVVTVNRGRVKRFTYTSRELAWLAWQAQVLWSELRSLWAALVPDVDDWFDSEGT